MLKWTLTLSWPRSSKASKVGLGIEAKSSWAVSQVASWMVEDKTTFGQFGACSLCMLQFREAALFYGVKCIALRDWAPLLHLLHYFYRSPRERGNEKRPENNGTVFFPVLSLTQHFCHCSHSNAVDYLTTHTLLSVILVISIVLLRITRASSYEWEQKDLDLM